MFLGPPPGGVGRWDSRFDCQTVKGEGCHSLAFLPLSDFSCTALKEAEATGGSGHPRAGNPGDYLPCAPGKLLGVGRFPALA